MRQHCDADREEPVERSLCLDRTPLAVWSILSRTAPTFPVKTAGTSFIAFGTVSFDRDREHAHEVVASDPDVTVRDQRLADRDPLRGSYLSLRPIGERERQGEGEADPVRRPAVAARVSEHLLGSTVYNTLSDNDESADLPSKLRVEAHSLSEYR